MRRSASGTMVLLIFLIAGCGGDEAAQPAPPTDLPTSDRSSPEASSSAGEPAPDASGDAEVLTGVVGQEGDPDAFVITLTDSSGSELTTVPAGEYEVRVNDLSAIHNFRLTGPGVDESTTVPGTGEATWMLTLEPGDYTFVCDPHPQQMTGGFTVT